LLPLADAALCRSAVGLAHRQQRHTRHDSLQLERRRFFTRQTVGVCRRRRLRFLSSARIAYQFQGARDYWEIHGTFAAAQGEYAGRWFDESFQKAKEDGEARPESCGTRSRPRPSARKCLGKSGVATEEAKPVSQLSPLLYDLTSLQREANGRFGFSRNPKNHRSRSHKRCRKAQGFTYRGGFSGAAEDYLGTVKKTLDTFAAQKASGYARVTRPRFSRRAGFKPNRRYSTTRRFRPLRDHPYDAAAATSVRGGKKLYDLVVKRFLAVFSRQRVSRYDPTHPRRQARLSRPRAEL